MRKIIFLILAINIFNCKQNPFQKEKENSNLPAFIALASLNRTSANSSSTCTSGTTCTSPPCLNICYKFNSTQDRLGNLGTSVSIPAGNAGQNPDFKSFAAHYYELTQNANTALGSGTVIYTPPLVTDTSQPINDVKRNAFNFTDLKQVKEYEIALSIPLKNITAATYQYLRISLAYQEYDIKLRVNNTSAGSLDFTGRLSSFVGVNTFITSYKNNDETVLLNAFRSQGYWYFNPDSILVSGVTVNPASSTGQAPATTVVNPIAGTSPIPAGSCVVTNSFDSPLTITGKETKDINIVASLSTNKSFEWRDLNSNGIWEPADGETVVDMGLRGIRFIVY